MSLIVQLHNFLRKNILLATLENIKNPSYINLTLYNFSNTNFNHIGYKKHNFAQKQGLTKSDIIKRTTVFFFNVACVNAIFLNVKVSTFIIYLDIKRRISKSSKLGREATGNVSKQSFLYDKAIVN